MEPELHYFTTICVDLDLSPFNSAIRFPDSIIDRIDRSSPFSIISLIGSIDDSFSQEDENALLEARTWSDDELDEPLSFHNVPEPLKSSLIRAATAMDAEDATLALGAALDARFIMDPVPASPARPIALVGGPGSGKTVTAAKLAAQSVLAGKKKYQSVLHKTATKKLPYIVVHHHYHNTSILEYMLRV